MKVLHIIPSYYPAFKLGGPIQSVHLINKHLVKMGIDVDVLTLNVGLEKANDYNSRIWYNIDGVKVKYLNYFKLTRYNFSFSFLIIIFPKRRALTDDPRTWGPLVRRRWRCW